MNNQRSFCLALGILAAIPTSAHALTEFAVNGGFETGNFTGWTQFPTGAGQQTVTSLLPSSGTFSANINNTVIASNSLFKQANVGIGSIMPGQAVTISFDAKGSFGPGGVAFAEFFTELAGGGTSSSQILGGGPLNLHPTEWRTFTYNVNAGPITSGGVTLQLGAATGATPGSFANVSYDNVSIQSVPEPASMAALGLGAAALLRKRRKAQA